jgi:hypothetical protein
MLHILNYGRTSFIKEQFSSQLKILACHMAITSSAFLPGIPNGMVYFTLEAFGGDDYIAMLFIGGFCAVIIGF